MLLYKAEVLKHAHRRILLLFVPITLVATPLGQLASSYVPTQIVQAVAGSLVTFVSCFEMYRKRNWFLSVCKKTAQEDDNGGNSNNNNEAKKDVEMGIVVKETMTESRRSESTKEEEKTIDSARNATNSGVEQSEAQQQGIDSTFKDDKVKDVKEEDDDVKIGINKVTFWTLVAGGASGFLGGMVAIRGPPLIFYFLHPPHPVKFNKCSQRATGVVIMFFNVFMREVFFLVNTFTDTDENKVGYEKEDWRLYLSVIMCSIAGGIVGSKLFEYVKDSKDTIRSILAIFLFLCGVSLLFSAFR